MNKKKMIMSTMFVLSMTFGGVVGCNNQTETNPTTQNVKKKVTLGKKANSEEKADEIVKTESSSTQSKSEIASTTETSNANTSSNNSSTSTSNKVNTASTSSSSNKNNNSNSSNSSSSQHTHNWVAQTKTVHHEASYTKKYVIDQEGKDVQLPQYETVEIHVGNQSGLVISGDPNEYLLNNSNGDNGWHSELEQKLVGYKTTHQDEIGHWEDVLVQDAYDETVTTGYKCSTCGKTK